MARQAVERLLVDGSLGAVHEAGVDGVFEQARQERTPIELVATEQPVGVRPVEPRRPFEVGSEPPVDTARENACERQEQRPRQPESVTVASPSACEPGQLGHSRQSLRRRRQVEGQPGRGRLEQKSRDRVGNVVDRNDVDPGASASGDQAQRTRQVAAQRDVDRVERLDLPCPGVAHDHPRPHDRDRELAAGAPDDPLALVLRTLVSVREPALGRERALRDRSAPPPGDVGGRHMQQTLDAVIARGGTHELDHVRRALDVRPSQLLDRRVDPQVGRRVDDMGDTANQTLVGVGGKSEPRGRDVPRQRLHPPAELLHELRPVPPRPGEAPRRLLIVAAADEGNEVQVGPREQAPCDLRAEEAGGAREEDGGGHRSTGQPRSAKNSRSSPGFRFARASSSA